MSRIDEVNDLIKDEVSKAFPKILDREYGLVTVLKADVTKDLKKADVWISVFGEDQDEKFRVIKEKTFLVQQEVASNIKIKFTPKIELHLDKTGEYAFHIESLLSKIETDDRKKH